MNVGRTIRLALLVLLMSLSLTAKNQYPSGRVIQRQRTGTGTSTSTNVPVAGTYTGTVSGLEYSWQGSAYAAVTGATISGGIWSATLPGLNQGIGTLSLRATNDHSQTDSATLLLGDQYAVGGDSTVNFTSQTAPTGGTVWGYDDAADQWDDAVALSAAPSYWGLLFSQLSADQNCPIAFVLKNQSGSSLMSHWQQGQTNYNALKTACLASGVNAFKAVLIQVTNNDMQPIGLGGTPSTNTLVGGLQSMAAGFAADLPGAPTTFNWIFQLGYAPSAWADGATAFRTVNDQVLQATLTARDNGYLAGVGAVMTNWDLMNAGGDGEHPVSTADKKEVAYRWYPQLAATLYGKTTAAPKKSTITSNPAKDTFVVTLNRAISTPVNTDVGGFRVVNGSGTAATITSCKVTSSTEVTIVTSAGQSGAPLVSFGSSEDAVNQTVPYVTVSLPDTTNGATWSNPLEPFFNAPIDGGISPSSSVSPSVSPSSSPSPSQSPSASVSPSSSPSRSLSPSASLSPSSSPSRSLSPSASQSPSSSVSPSRSPSASQSPSSSPSPSPSAGNSPSSSVSPSVSPSVSSSASASMSSSASSSASRSPSPSPALPDATPDVTVIC